MAGLRIPSSARVVEFHDRASGAFYEDLDVRVVLSLHPADTRRLAAHARALRAYKPVAAGACIETQVTRAGVSFTGECDAAGELDRAGAGFFRYERTGEASYALAVLDTVRNRLVVQVIIL